jgi:hypothetical protein
LPFNDSAEAETRAVSSSIGLMSMTWRMNGGVDDGRIPTDVSRARRHCRHVGKDHSNRTARLDTGACFMSSRICIADTEMFHRRPKEVCIVTPTEVRYSWATIRPRGPPRMAFRHVRQTLFRA